MNPEKYLPWLKALGVIVIALVIAYYVGTRTGKAKQENLAEDQLKKEIAKNELTFEQTQYSAMADKLETAMYGFTNDADAVNSVFTRLRTKSDVLNLIKIFGTRRMIWTWGNSSLNTWINSRLNTSQIAHVNDILSRNGIDYQF